MNDDVRARQAKFRATRRGTHTRLEILIPIEDATAFRSLAVRRGVTHARLLRQLIQPTPRRSR